MKGNCRILLEPRVPASTASVMVSGSSGHTRTTGTRPRESQAGSVALGGGDHVRDRVSCGTPPSVGRAWRTDPSADLLGAAQHSGRGVGVRSGLADSSTGCRANRHRFRPVVLAWREHLVTSARRYSPV